MGESVRLSREALLDEAAQAIGNTIRAKFHLQPSELSVSWRLDPDGNVRLLVSTLGLGTAADFDAFLTEQRNAYINILDIDLWSSTVGERQVLAEMSDDTFAARMRSKVSK